MRKGDRSKRRSEKRTLQQNPIAFVPTEVINHQPKPIAPLRPMNDAQYDYIESIRTNIITFGIGPAGTGKTYIAASIAAEMLKTGEIDKIIMTRPGVDAGRNWGALPGELAEKYAPYMEPLVDVLNERLGKSYTDYLFKRGSIQAKPLELMRGKTFSKCFYILDEAQNTTHSQMKLFVTRIGEDCKVVIDGDLAQKDINGASGLLDATNRLAHISRIGRVNFTVNDCVRSGIVKEILRAYD